MRSIHAGRIHAGLAAFFALVPVVMAVPTIACSSAQSQTRVDSAEAHRLVHEGATLLDVRSDAEWAEGHLPGAVHIPVQQLAQRMGEVPRDHGVVVYCLSGGRSAQAAAMLASAGYEVHDLGGMSNW
jgi:rhodanese-related sulfurtransferase